MIRWATLLCCLIWPVAASAFELSLPAGARLISDRSREFDSHALPLAPWDGAQVPVRQVEGRLTRQSWRINSAGLTTLQVFAPLRDQLLASGFETILDCAAPDCGGFDFRFAVEVIPAPDMYVDIRDYRVLSAQRGQDVLSLIVSRSSAAAFVQLVHVSPLGSTPATVATTAPAIEPAVQGSFGDALVLEGYAVLEGVVFDTGSTDLAAPDAPSLDALADFLQANPGARIALVGHTDATGALDVNIAVSRRRAEAVRGWLVSTGIDGARIAAEGMGYLAPRASNLTPEGRELNRRVEVILLALE
jgi:OOP family OmpA-OmpF porin